MPAFYYFGILASCRTAHQKATVDGGVLTSDSTYYYRTFTSSGTLNVTGPVGLTADILVLGGGGAGNGGQYQNSPFVNYLTGGGGGAGGLKLFSGTSLSVASYSVTVGLGGAVNSGNGGGSSLGSYSVSGGGGGYGNSGGSGGGNSSTDLAGTTNNTGAGAGTAGQG